MQREYNKRKDKNPVKIDRIKIYYIKKEENPKFCSLNYTSILEDFTFAEKYSRFIRAIFLTEIPLGHSASHA